MGSLLVPVLALAASSCQQIQCFTHVEFVVLRKPPISLHVRPDIPQNGTQGDTEDDALGAPCVPPEL